MTKTQCSGNHSNMSLAPAHLFKKPSMERALLHTKRAKFMRQGKGALLAGLMILFVGKIWPENGNAFLLPALSSSQIVENMQRHDQEQLKALQGYKDLRHYAIEYRGFFRTVAAKMDVEVSYDVTSGKSFRIVAQSGSGVLCDKVLKRALDSEKEASLNKGATALTPANYRFQLVGSESLGGRPAYILYVEPVTPSKFLYRGKIWVDATDFAVMKMEVQPAKNPSFWISRTQIHHSNAETGGFWLPAHNQSETKVRIGGTAVLTIDYGTYQIAPGQLRHVVAELH